MPSGSAISARKARLRQEIKNQWRLMSWGGYPHFLKERLQDNLRSWLARHPGIWGSYLPMSSEADPGFLQVPGVSWVFPRMNGKLLEFAPLSEKSATELPPQKLGIRQPPQGVAPVEPRELKGLLIPGLAFDGKGRRLGRGAGYYDLTLHSNAKVFHGLKVGIAYEFQMRRELPAQAHDVPMDVIITDQSVKNEEELKRWKW